MVSASHHLEHAIMQSASIFHVRRVSASAPNLLSLSPPSTPHHTAAPLDRYGEIQTEEVVVSASLQLEHTLLQIFAQTACQNSVCSGFWKLRKIGIMRSPRLAFSMAMCDTIR